MTNNTSGKLRIGEPYFYVRDLSDEEERALAILSSPSRDKDCVDAEDAETASEPMDDLLHFFLTNAVQYAERHSFDPDSKQGFADLASFAEYLLDAMSLMSKADESQLEEMVLASFMAKIALDAMTSLNQDPQNVWNARLAGAENLYRRCTRR